jgi:hypothetical protein
MCAIRQQLGISHIVCGELRKKLLNIVVYKWLVLGLHYENINLDVYKCTDQV